MPNESSPLALRLSGIVKTFGPVVANRGASLEVKRGEIHALVGENGAGKSTLMRMLGGLFPPDEGTIEVNGRDVTGWSTAEAIAANVGMVHQHFMLVPTLTVAENVVLGMEFRRGLLLDRGRAEREVEALSKRTGLAVDVRRRVADLSVGEAQRVEILKVLFRGAKILILDEPTAVLSPPEVTELWAVLRTLRDGGDTIVLITHKLDEVVAISDAITVMRSGRTVDRLVTSQTTPAAIARSMVGRDVALPGELKTPVRGDLPPGATPASLGGVSENQPVVDPGITPPIPASALAGERAAVQRARSVVDVDRREIAARAVASLEVHDLIVSGPRRASAVNGVSFTVEPGEILGIAGVEGNGQTELIEAIAGLRRPISGRIRVGARDITNLTVNERAYGGLSHVPEDRHRRGLVLDYSVADNLILGRQDQFSSGGRLDFRRIAEHAEQQIRDFDIRPDDPSLPARALSGGNQQKVVIAREMGRDFRVLLAAQPTRGVDVGAIEFIHARLHEARQAGKAILLVSAELNEILALADRIAVMYGGRIVKVMPRAEANEEVLGPYMTGASAERAA